jgi:hexulose-6-phosphate isomerase
MQGRLVPPVEDRIQCFPRERWQDEFSLAAQANLGCIEWIHDQYGADVNPISTDAGVTQIKSLVDASGVQIRSLCADTFMDLPLVRATESELEERLSLLEWLLHRCELVGINRLILPFVDVSKIDTDDEMKIVSQVINSILKTAEQKKVEIHLETSLPPHRFAKLLGEIPHPMVKVNYDSGNSSSLGYKPDEEFAAYGSRIGSVHIKDRILGGSTVALGTGSADFKALARCLATVNYQGDIILQVARGTAGEEVAWANLNRAFVAEYILL